MISCWTLVFHAILCFFYEKYITKMHIFLLVSHLISIIKFILLVKYYFSFTSIQKIGEAYKNIYLDNLSINRYAIIVWDYLIAKILQDFKQKGVSLKMAS